MTAATEQRLDALENRVTILSDLLMDRLGINRAKPVSGWHNDANKLIELASITFGISEANILSRQRTRASSHARFAVFYALRRLHPDVTMTAIGERFGYDPTSVLYAINAVSNSENGLRTKAQFMVDALARGGE